MHRRIFSLNGSERANEELHNAFLDESHTQKEAKIHPFKVTLLFVIFAQKSSKSCENWRCIFVRRCIFVYVQSDWKLCTCTARRKIDFKNSLPVTSDSAHRDLSFSKVSAILKKLLHSNRISPKRLNYDIYWCVRIWQLNHALELQIEIYNFYKGWQSFKCLILPTLRGWIMFYLLLI